MRRSVRSRGDGRAVARELSRRLLVVRWLGDLAISPGMGRVLEVAASGYYEWLQRAISHRAIEAARLLWLIRASFEESTST